MSEQDQMKMAKNRFNNRGNQVTKTSYKSKVAKLEDEVFDVGVFNDPAKLSKSMKSIDSYTQVNYKTCDYFVKAIQQLKHPTLNYPNRQRW